MICPTCSRAADQRAPRTQHCDDPGCTCGHNVQRYGTTTAGVQQPELTVAYASPPMLYTACDEGRHIAHPCETCEEYETDRAAMSAAWDRLMAPINKEISALHADTATED